MCQSLAEKDGETNSDCQTPDPWIAIQVDELGKAFRDFSRELERLSRLAQRKKKVCIPSEAFNQLLTERMEKVERSFLLYMRRKEELLVYIKSTVRRNDDLYGTQVTSPRFKPDMAKLYQAAAFETAETWVANREAWSHSQD
jgi:hypothetical protein